MRPAEEGLLLLCCALGTQDVPLTPAQYRTLARRVRQTCQAGDGEVTPAYLRALGYPEAAAEADILRLARDRAREQMQPPAMAVERMPLEDVFRARAQVLDLHLAPALERYLIELVLASRDAARYDTTLARRIAWGASPRGSIALERCARARAWLAGRDYVTPDDIRAIAPDVLRHRVLPSYEATAEGWDGDRLVKALLDVVPLP